jgi:predicted transcriptional regulator
MNRCRLEIVGDMLRYLPDCKSHIMQKANLSHRNINKFLAYVIEKELMKKGEKGLGNSKAIYYRTARGDHYLECYERLVATLDESKGSEEGNCANERHGEAD